MLSENYKSSEQGAKQEFLEKVALAEVKANDALNQLNAKDDEIAILKREIDSLRGRIQEAYSEKDKMVSEISGQLNEVRIEKELKRTGNEEELRQTRETVRRLEDEIHNLERALLKKEKDVQENEAMYKRQIDLLKNQASSNVNTSQELLRQKAEYEKLIEEKEQQRLRQKNEWAEVLYKPYNRFTET